MRPRAGVRLVAGLAAAALFAGCWCTAEAGSSDGAAAGDGSGGPGLADPPALRFKTLTAAETGIDVQMRCGEIPSRQIIEVNGGGLGLIDYDNDGDLDLFVANGATIGEPENGPGCRLYENLGRLRFRDVTRHLGISVRRWAMGVAVGDYDGDGRDDLYLTCYGPNILLRNVGGRFQDVTKEAGVGDSRWGTSAAFGDIDGDGDLDLYVVNYLHFDLAHPPPRSRFKGVVVMAGPRGLTPEPDVLYENIGDGTFRDISAASACGAVQAAYGLSVVILDLDGDGRQDIFVGNDSMANFLFHNLGGARFEEIGRLSGVAANADGSEQATMGIGIADVDGNGSPDVFTTNFSGDTNTLQINLGENLFDDRTMQFGLGMVSRTFLGWSCGFYDFDLDGDEDLLAVNGHVYPEASMEAMDSPYQQPLLLFARTGARFQRVTDPQVGAFLGEPHRDRAAVFGDLDGDGDIDVVVGELNGPVRVLRNDRSGGGEWLIIQLSDTRPAAGNHRGLGSRVEVTGGGVTRRRWIYGGGFQSASASYAHFGLPSGSGPFAVQIIWPDGFSQRLNNISGGQHLVVVRPHNPLSPPESR